MPMLHIGDHTVLRLSELGAHLIEPDHVFVAVLTTIVGIAAYRYGRRVEARQVARERPDDRS